METLDPQSTYENWLNLLEIPDSDTLDYIKIRAEAEYLSENFRDPLSLDYSRKGFLLLETAADSVKAEIVKNKIITEFPASEATYDLAYEEFYELIYPIWREDSLKVEVISVLLEKYPETGWRRTMYQYLLYSLDQIGDKQELNKQLNEFRQAFPQDYLPWLLTARYLDTDDVESEKLIEYATTAMERSYNYPHVDFYPEMEWQLEARSAPVKAVAGLARILNEQGRFEESKKILEEIILNNSLTVDDETTLAGCYYYLAQAYEGLEMSDLAEKYAVLALISGDSRNYYTPLADTLLTELLSHHRGLNSNLNFSRKIMEYQDVTFTDVTEEYGLLNINAGRIAWGDYDRDGWQDMLLNGSRLFRNLEGKKFVEVTSSAFPDTIRANGGLWGDFDNDGDLDIITKDPESLWLNDNGVFYQNGQFSDNGVSTEGLGLGDVNQDGFLDLYVANYEKNYVYETDQFFLGNKDSGICRSNRE